MEEAPAAPARGEAAETPARGDESGAQGTDRPYLLPLSARDPAALLALARRYEAFLAADQPGASPALADVCWSASRRRRHHQHRMAVVGRSRDELRGQLASAADDQADLPGTARGTSKPKLVFVFPGQGSQWTGMSRQLLEREPVFRTAVENCDELIRHYTGWSLLTQLSGDDEDGAWLERTDRVQLALFGIQVGLAAWWRSVGVEPDAVVGHSVGEIAAAYVAGALSLDDAVHIIYERNRLIEEALGQGRMLATSLTLDQAHTLLAGHEAQASVAIINSPRSIVLSGDPGVLEPVAATLRGQETFHRWINVDFASHSPQMDPLVTRLRESLWAVFPHRAAVPIVSTVTGSLVDGSALDAAYWARNLRDPVLFGDATRWLREQGHDVFVEISPHPVLLPAIEDSLYQLSQPGITVPSLHRDSDEQQSLLTAVGALYRAGQAIWWDHLCPSGGRYVRLPAYPWQRHRYWVDQPRETRHPLTADGTAAHPLLGRKLRSPLREVQFESELCLSATPYLDGHRVCGRLVFPAAGYLEMLAQAVQDGDPRLLTDVVMHDLLTLTDSEPRRLQTVLTPAGDGEARLELFGWDRGPAAWRCYVTAHATAGPPADNPAPLDLDEVRDRCPREISPAAFYERLRELGLEYGPQFRGIESIRAGDGEAIGRVRLPTELAADAGRYGVHPALLDACLQLTGAALAGDDVAASPAAAGGGRDVYLPVRVGSFRVAVPGQAQVTGHAIIRAEADGQSRTGDVRLYDGRGQLVAQVLGLQVRKVSRAALRTALTDDLNDWFYELQWRRQQRATASPPGPADLPDERGNRWLILADGGGVGQALADQLEQRGDTATIVERGVRYQHEASRATFHLDPARPEHFTRMLAADGGGYYGVIYLWALDATPAEHTTAESLSADEALACGGALHLAQALVRQPWAPSARLWLLTRGAQAPPLSAAPPAPAQAPLWGLGRTLRTEHPDLPCVLVDLDNSTASDDARILLAEADAARRGSHEDQVAFRRGERFVARLTRSAPRSGAEPALSLAESRQGIRLVVPEHATLDALTFDPAERPAPAAGEVEIRVRATGLNFRDVLNALGAYPGDAGPLGLECAGEITAVGEGVGEHHVGDAVVALAPGCFGTFVTAPAMLAARKPESLSYAEAATIPVSFMTASYALCHLAQISPGDTILIHAAAGGLGLAAAQLALRAGADVFGTAGNEEKRSYLRSLGLRHVMDSRTLDFAAEVKELTDGRGVDIVLNSLNGEYIPRNLSILATGGRFAEVGKIGIWDSERIRQARPDASYFIVDLDLETRRDPAKVGGMLRQLMRDFDSGALHPLPRHIFALPEATDAFRFMAQARQTGKIVITQEVGLSSAAGNRLRENASYLITGGLGGLGLRVARWMADRGAQHLALIGRSEPSAPAQVTVDELTRAGVHVQVISADVAQPDQVTRALAEISASMPPLRGIVHAAGVLDDGLMLRQDWERFARVLAPKVQGAWNLHAQTCHLPLDFFVLFSSTAALWGNAGQSSYAAANAFLDALAHARRAQGLPALSINWGAWSQVGLAARNGVTEQLSKHDMDVMTPDAGVRALEQAMGQQAAQLAIAPIDWAALLARSAGHLPLLLAELSREPTSAPAGERPAAGRSALLRRLDAASPGNRPRVLAAYLDEQARLALGLDPQVTLDPRRPLSELGLDSLMAIEMRSRLSSAAGQVLPATVLFDYPTIEGLSGYLGDEVLHLASGTANDHDPAGAIPPAATGDRDARAADSAGRSEAADVTRLSAEGVEADLAEELAAVQALLGKDPS
ncbi:MAG: SDR family NAD(P)-dependent oxidoreductase [Actinomycetota bacterium]|nr:SDR family NAD(P)-dependent oxidoreductase [Actinomycetota bacterium]